MTLVFDTSILIDLERGEKNILEALRELKDRYPSPPKITFISYFEFLHGIRNRKNINKEKCLSFLNMFEVIQTTKITAKVLSILKSNYELPLADLLIASQVIENDLLLLTKDKDFQNIEELQKILLTA